ncbi:MAG: zinc-finger domain-containing protein [Alphaproteobacteria bacterium]|nr:zinc-finger domain-containing protein [Alphaproteobacteria bacterium]
MEPPEIVEVESTTLACDGGDGARGHPRVFLNMGEKTKIDCPYCSRQYVLKAGAVTSAGH